LTVAEPNDSPVWKNAKYYERVQNGEVIVSVSTTAKAPELTKKWRLILQGGGELKASREFAFATAQKYEDLPRASGYIKKADYDPSSRLLAIDIEAFGYAAHQVVHVVADASGEPWKLKYKVVVGPMAGMHGAVQFYSIKAKVSDVGITGQYDYDKFPIPRMFLSFGMEAMLKFMAVRLRSFVESEFKKTAPAPAGQN
jgi:hypothetical protein